MILLSPGPFFYIWQRKVSGSKISCQVCKENGPRFGNIDAYVSVMQILQLHVLWKFQEYVHVKIWILSRIFL